MIETRARSRLGLAGTFLVTSLSATTGANQAEPNTLEAGGRTVVEKSMPINPALSPVFVRYGLSSDWVAQTGGRTSIWGSLVQPQRTFDPVNPFGSILAPHEGLPLPVMPPMTLGASRRACDASFGITGKFAAAVLRIDAFGHETMAVDVAGDELRHPASLTKVMTLLLAFKAIEDGKLKTSDTVNFSAHALAAEPVNLAKIFMQLGVKHLSVEQTMYAAGTRSANDAAVALAERIAGSEKAFAEQMTAMARTIGMKRTVYRNASGLPDPRQVITANEQAMLMRYVSVHYPQYIKYLSASEFSIPKRNRALAIRAKRNVLKRNFIVPAQFVLVKGHLALLGSSLNRYRVGWGKTGFTFASGSNLAVGAKGLDGSQVVAVILGGRNTAARDSCMQAMVSRL